MPGAIPGDMAGPEFTVTSGSVAAPARHPSSHVCGDAPASELHWYGGLTISSAANCPACAGTSSQNWHAS